MKVGTIHNQYDIVTHRRRHHMERIQLTGRRCRAAARRRNRVTLLRGAGFKLFPPNCHIRDGLLRAHSAQLTSVKIGLVRFHFARLELFGPSGDDGEVGGMSLLRGEG